MTLILSCATEEHVIQASDRRLTSLHDGSLITDEQNKAVLFCGRVAFAYTGLATMPGNVHTDLWIAQRLADERCNTIAHALRVLRARATDAFVDIRLDRRKKRHSIVGIGWTRNTVDAAWLPVYCLITNAQSPDGSWMPEATEEFRTELIVGTGRKSVAIHWAGSGFSNEDVRALTATLGESIGRRSTALELRQHVLDALARAATRSNTIGKSMMAVVLPRSALGSKESIAISGAPRADMVSFEYIAKERTHGTQFGPHSVCRGSGGTDFQFIPLAPDNLADGTVSARYLAARDLQLPLEEEIRRLWRRVEHDRADVSGTIQSCRRILQKLEGRTFSKSFFLEVHVKANFELGIALIDQGEVEAAIPHFEAALTTLELSSGDEPLKYRVLCLNNLAVYHLRRAGWTQVIMFCENALRLLDAAAGERSTTTHSQALIDRFGNVLGRELARQRAKSLRNMTLAQMALGDSPRARLTAQQLLSEFASATDEEIQGRVREIQTRFQGLD